MAKPTTAKGKAPAKSTLPRTLFFTLVFAVLVWTLTSEDAAPTRSARKKPRTKTEAKTGLVTPADFTAKFTPFGEAPRDAFKPAVFRQRAEIGVQAVAKPTPEGVVPVIGEDGASWVYTGLASIDGATLGLLENRATGEGVFVRPNEEWKGNRIVSVAERFLVLRDGRGTLRTVKVGGPEAVPKPEETGLRPLQPPPLQGAIGNIAVQPLPPAVAAEALPAETTRRGRRGRRNQQGSPDAN